MTRIEFGGLGVPIPTEGLPDGVVDETLSPLLFELENGLFVPTDFIGLGYTHYEVMCVGAAGGRGGMASFGGSYGDKRVHLGGGGGGGGMQIVSGALADLDPAGEPVVVGVAGANGADGVLASGSADPDRGQPGADGGYSSFGGDICRASGGKGGERTYLGVLPADLPPEWEYDEVYPSWHFTGYHIPGGRGGDGGKGGQTTAGGGGKGGSAKYIDTITGQFASPEPRWATIAPEQGYWADGLGTGGGGGLGGTMYWYVTYNSTPGI